MADAETDLIDLVHQGRVWGVVAAGASADAGVPSWARLLERVVEGLSQQERQAVDADARYAKAVSRDDYAQAFSRVEEHAGREQLERQIGAIVSATTLPGGVLRELAQWPLRNYITTNYDSLLETALSRANQRGWLTVGNSSDEIPKVGGDPEKVVWHVHGAVSLPNSKSRLVITERDYDDQYADDTPTSRQLRAVLSQARVVCIGFGLSDPELMRMLKRVGRMTTPARPIYAFANVEKDEERAELLERFNIDVIPYRLIRGSHRQLCDLLKSYGALMVRRSTQFRSTAPHVPSYDPETTGLLLYNELVLRGGGVQTRASRSLLLRSRVLSMLADGEATLSTLETDVAARARLLRAAGGVGGSPGRSRRRSRTGTRG